MTNRLRSQIEEEEREKRLIVEENNTREIPDNYVMQRVVAFFTAERASRALPFVLFLALLGMIYIANSNVAEGNIRDIAKISKQVKELSWEYKTSKAELAYKSTLTQVAKRADTLGIKESVQPPQKLKEDVQDGH